MSMKQEKRNYERPTMTVVEIDHGQQLLAGSGNYGRAIYENGNEDIPSQEIDEEGYWNW